MDVTRWRWTNYVCPALLMNSCVWPRYILTWYEHFQSLASQHLKNMIFWQLKFFLNLTFFPKGEKKPLNVSSRMENICPSKTVVPPESIFGDGILVHVHILLFTGESFKTFIKKGSRRILQNKSTQHFSEVTKKLQNIWNIILALCLNHCLLEGHICPQLKLAN